MITAHRLTELGRVASVAPAPDGTWLAVAVARLDADDSKYVHDLWRVPVDGGPATVLTPGPFNDRAPAFRSDGALLFLSNRPVGKKAEDGEDERAQVWALPGAGEPTRLTDEPLGVMRFEVAGDTLACFARVWPDVAHDAQREHASTTKKHGPSVLRYTRTPVRYWDHWEPVAAPHLVVYDADGSNRRDLTPEATFEHRAEPEMCLSPDGARVALGVIQDNSERMLFTAMHVVDLASGETVERVAEARGSVGSYRFSPSGARLAYVRAPYFDERVHERNLWVREGGEERRLLEDWDRWATPQAFLDEDTLVVSFDDGGETRLATVNVVSGERQPLEAGGTHGGVKAFAGGYAGVAHTLKQPPRPFVVSGGERRWLAELSELGDATQELRVERFGTEASDGATIDTRLVLPPGDGPHPLLFWIHGGPISFFGDTWHWRWNAAVMAEAGFAVALPNARGSTGYGYDFVTGIWGNQWGAQCYDDLMRVTDALASRDDIDAERMVAMGGSFGGYMSNWIGGQTDRFAAIVTHASLFDLRAFYGSTDVPTYFGKHNASTPWEGEIDKYSPHRFAPRWKSPTLVIHGDKDYRVPITEALALFEGLQAHGVDSELVVFPDENHWILKPRNIRAWYGAVLDFVAARLGD